MTQEKILLDANVLYSNFIRDLLLSLFAARLYDAKWTDEINDEWVRHLLKNRTDIDPQRIKRTLELMNGLTPSPLVANYRHLIEQITLPDKDDRHVLAAAIACGAKKILTWNLRDFPARFLNEFGISSENPDRFISALIIAKPQKVVEVFRAARLRQKRPKMEVDHFFAALQQNKLSLTSAQLERFRADL